MSVERQTVSDAADRHASIAARAALFVVIGLALYGLLYVGAEGLVKRYGFRNRFFSIARTPAADFHVVILGASHAGVLDYRQMNAEVERALGGRVINLAVVGAGPVVNRLLLDYFFDRHRTDTVLYLVDSFAFYKSDWNEDRLADARLFQRAPFDLALARLIITSPAPWSTKLEYISGFVKTNNHKPFAPDTREEEGPRFDRSYRPVPQIDQQRLEYLFPDRIDDAARLTRTRYLRELENLVEAVQSRGVRFVAVRPPLPERIRRRLPGEQEFDEALAATLGRHGLSVVDLSQTIPDDKFFYDTDHLNQTGTRKFIEELKPVLAPRETAIR